MKKPEAQSKSQTLRQRFNVLEGRKGTLHTRNEKYARWTLPYLYPMSGQKNTELDADLDSIGARAVNHLSNKLTSTLFPATRPFLRLEIADDVREGLKAKKVPMDKLDQSLAQGEKKAVRQLDKMAHRTISTEASKYLIVTGNALMYYPEGENTKCQVYNTRDYCVVRDLSGTVIEIITRDMKAFETFAPAVQEKLRASAQHQKKPYDDNCNVTIFTQIKLKDNGKFAVKQGADDVDLETPENEYARADLPWIPLAWNLVRGEDYGRGMVEDYRNAFGLLDVLSKALVEGIIAAADVKFLVNPASVLDVVEMNAAPSGSYHSGKDGDVVAIKSDKHLDFEQVRKVLEDYTRQIAQAFLLNSAVTRDAERVTAEEIRYQAQELETAYGGVYSRFTEDWQVPVAHLLLSRQKIAIGDDTLYPVIVTGLDTLSRLGDIDNYRMFMEDISIVNNIPQPMQPYINIPKLLAFAGTNRGVDYSKFMNTPEEVQEQQEMAMNQEKALMQEQTGNQILQDGAKEVMKEDEE